ncbi:MAG: CDP-diacylglycerol--glycerol-3-phosphate 3-phosphatidyltransferase [Spirochaetota bacterium]
MNIPNMLSLLRIVLIPLFLYLLFQPGPVGKIWAITVFIIASITDFLDGWSARKLNQYSELGKFLDPLADKFLVIAALTAFLILDPLIPVWMVVIIVARDLLITLLRFLAVRKGSSIRTSRFGKVKTAFQMVSIIIIITVFIFKSFGYTHDTTSRAGWPLGIAFELLLSGECDMIVTALPYWLMFIVTMVTAFSGIRYLATNFGVLLPPYTKRNQGEESEGRL